MRTLRLSLVGTVILVLVGWSSNAVMAQEGSDNTGAVGETAWELPIPVDALPTEFVKLVVKEWTLAPGTDTTGDRTSVLGNEALRGRGIFVEGGEWLVTPASDALLWQGTVGEPRTTPAGEAVTLVTGDAILLPAVPHEEVEPDTPIGIANPGTEEATALSFHTHQDGGSFYGFPQGLTLGDWDMAAAFDPDAITAFDGADIILRLSRVAGDPGATVPIPDAPTVAMYFVESGQLEQVVSGPKGDFTWTHDIGRNFQPQHAWPVTIAGDGSASVLELAAIPRPPDES
jgi:hypothetical protein